MSEQQAGTLRWLDEGLRAVAPESRDRPTAGIGYSNSASLIATPARTTAKSLPQRDWLPPIAANFYPRIQRPAVERPKKDCLLRGNS